ncbi:MAG: hypothetical protein ACD_65C00264G0001 [uncultured bacterium]|nr:MAG: hypothetical protein ACD_65C00264G0001 [uncultured bacterium]
MINRNPENYSDFGSRVEVFYLAVAELENHDRFFCEFF